MDRPDSDIIEAIKGTKVTLRTATGLKTMDVEQLFTINADNLSHEFATQASIYAFFSVLQAQAEDASSRADFTKDQEYAVADQYYRDRYDAEGKKFTEPSIKATVMTDQTYTEACNRRADKVFEAALLKALVKAMDQRAEMLVSLGSHLRHEADMTGMNIRESAYRDSVTEVKKVLDQRKAK
jgi:hypothetical protein